METRFQKRRGEHRHSECREQGELEVRHAPMKPKATALLSSACGPLLYTPCPLAYYPVQLADRGLSDLVR